MKYRLLAKLFHSSELKKLASGNLDTIHETIEHFEELSSSQCVADFYELAYSLLVRYYRNEYVVKNEIANKVLLGRLSMNTTSMLSELRTGSNIADCLLINGSSTCYEIKTEFDSLSRLNSQLNSYKQAYDKTYIVAHSTHLKKIDQVHKASPSFGIIELTKRNQLKKIEEAPQCDEFNFEITFETLRKPEYLFIAKNLLGEIPNMPNTSIQDYCKQAYFSLSPDVANKTFKKTLRKFRANDHNFINKLPKSLKNIGISYQLNRNEKNNILSSLTNDIQSHSGERNVLSIFTRQTP
ncbi:sce7726 family protein [Psychromonas sp. Urea-02u-13]|uniref:sce7726 family protein n=1 Tax=Psychromonas sp. Urea-02u-13 TaxID=2058326 RepID=UPI000C34A56E|nr:sce7726 family protein [Psychromonas sp. Urea-02u-13]PKG40364.1 hypothetical protein CXF74_03380 [Psychromonas sp. Urea-02u-13]